MKISQASSPKSRAWFPGRVVPLRRLAALEALPARSRAQIQVGSDTVHGTPRALLAMGVQSIQAAVRADPTLAGSLPESLRYLVAAS
jgi:hypothetical protein